MSSRKHRKATGDSARKSQPAAPRQEAQQPEARAPQFANQIGLAGSANPAVQAVQLQRLGTQSPSRAGRAARQLQRAYGNRHMAQVAQQARAGAGSSPVVQPKLAVTPPNDQYEDEADRVAGQVMRALDTPQPDTYEDEADRPAGQVMRALDASDPDKYEDEADRPAGQVMRKDVSAAAPAAGIAVPSGVEAAIEGARGGGQPLPEGTRATMESALGAEFGGVRVHADRESGALNEALSARAFTTGQDIFFKQGEYAPGSAEGQRLLAHELTHVVQQKANQTVKKSIQRDTDSLLDSANDRFEFFEDRATNTNAKGNTLTDAIRAEPKGASRDKAALGVYKAIVKINDDSEGLISEIEEAARIVSKVNKARLPKLSTDTNIEADLEYINDFGRVVAKEIKTISSDITSTVTTRLQEADAQLAKRTHATVKKILIKIQSADNTWPFAKNITKRKTQDEVVDKVIDYADKYLVNATALDVDGILLEPGTDDRANVVRLLRSKGKWVSRD